MKTYSDQDCPFAGDTQIPHVSDQRMLEKTRGSWSVVFARGSMQRDEKPQSDGLQTLDAYSDSSDDLIWDSVRCDAYNQESTLETAGLDDDLGERQSSRRLRLASREAKDGEEYS